MHKQLSVIQCSRGDKCKTEAATITASNEREQKIKQEKKTKKHNTPPEAACVVPETMKTIKSNEEKQTLRRKKTVN